MERGTHEASATPRDGRRPLGALLVGSFALALAIYWPSLPGTPISDDYGLLLNPWVMDLSGPRALELIDPRSQATLVLRNYAPVRPLLQGLEWRWFGETAPAYHVVNLTVHAVASWLFALLLLQAGLPIAAAALAAAWLLMHPAAVEAVAWMSQIWGPLALCFGIGALLAQRRRPLAALALFALALLTRPTAVCFLPAALLREWIWQRASGASPRRWLPLLGWLLVFALVSAAELQVFRDSGAAAQSPLDPDAWVRARTAVAGIGRYAAMAATGFGVAPFREPPVARSWLDPWWLLGIAAAIAIAARSLFCLRRGREEVAFWAWAVAAFVPVSQIFPFLYPMADRYLYFILPGLVGGVALAGRELLARLAERDRRRLARAATALVLAALAVFTLRSRERAALWTSEERVLADAALHSPDGVIFHLLRARSAASQGDVDGAVAALEVCRARGWDYTGYLLAHPAFEPVRSTPPFQKLLGEFAEDRIERSAARPRLSQLDLRDLAMAYRTRGRTDEAIAALERGIALGGPLDAELRGELARLRAHPQPDAVAPGSEATDIP